MTDRFQDVPIEASDYLGLKGETALRFGRFEYKYVIANSARPHFEAQVKKFMQLDPNCAEAPGSSYQVSSVYFDSPGLSAYHQKQDGVLNRRKFRIRRYGNEGITFLEEKGRRNAYSYKRRLPLPAELADAAASADWRQLLAAEPLVGRAPFTGFLAEGLRSALTAKVRVNYWRRAYIATGGYRFRVTFDDAITGARMPRPYDEGVLRQPALRGRTMVEIKFENQVPLWFVRLIEACEMGRVSLSKYCLCAEAVGLVRPDEPHAFFGTKP